MTNQKSDFKFLMKEMQNRESENSSLLCGSCMHRFFYRAFE